MSRREIEQGAASIEKLRGYRVRAERDTKASGPVGEVRDDLEKRIKQTGGMGEVWLTVAPDDLRDRAHVVSFQRGVLTLRARDSGTRFLVERWLRGGGRKMLSGCAPSTVRKVVVRVGTGD